MSDVDELRACISEEALALLKKLDYPCSEELLASAVSIEDEGVVELTGSRYDFESLAGFVAGDANHEDRRRKRPADLHCRRRPGSSPQTAAAIQRHG